MDDFDFDFLSLTLGMVGLFFICTAIMQQKPKYILEELFGVYGGGLRQLKRSVFKKNQLVLGFSVILVGLMLRIFSHSLALESGQGILNKYNPVTLAVAMVALVAFLCGVLNYLSRLFSKWHFRQIVIETIREHHWPFESTVALTLEIGQLLGLKRDADDTVERYLQKLRESLQLPMEAPGVWARDRGGSRTGRIGIEFR